MNDAVAVPSAALTEPERERPRVVVTTVSSDSHTWNLVWVQLMLEELGCEVVNLGPCVPDDLVLSTCLEIRPDLLLVSSVNGHGAIDGRRLIARVRATPGLEGVNAVIGGKLGVSGTLSTDEREALVRAGFDLVVSDTDAADLAELKALTRGKQHPHEFR